MKAQFPLLETRQQIVLILLGAHSRAWSSASLSHRLTEELCSARGGGQMGYLLAAR